jgi:hypothetical protein
MTIRSRARGEAGDTARAQALQRGRSQARRMAGAGATGYEVTLQRGRSSCESEWCGEIVNDLGNDVASTGPLSCENGWIEGVETHSRVLVAPSIEADGSRSRRGRPAVRRFNGAALVRERMGGPSSPRAVCSTSFNGPALLRERMAARPATPGGRRRRGFNGAALVRERMASTVDWGEFVSTNEQLQRGRPRARADGPGAGRDSIVPNRFNGAALVRERMGRR